MIADLTDDACKAGGTCEVSRGDTNALTMSREMDSGRSVNASQAHMVPVMDANQ